MNTNNNRNPSAGRRKARPTNKGRKYNPRAKAVSNLDPNLLVKKASSVTEKAFLPELSFSDMNLNGRLLANISKKGYEQPTEIQEAAIPSLMEGSDMIGVANTGTGKTGAFLIPIINRLLKNQKDPFTSIVIVPTRELAQQVETEFKSLAHGLNLYVSCYIGGTSIGKDIAKARRKSHLIVGTPGRLVDLSGQGILSLKDISVLVLDEFDRMLDMGFIHDVRKLISRMPFRSQTLLFSATVDKAQKKLIKEIVENPLEVKINSGKKASDNVEQKVIRVAENENKFEKLLQLLGEEGFQKVILFVETKHLADRVARKLEKAGIKTGVIHGNKSQNYRNRAIAQFKEKQTRILVATDVAARGIDIDEVSHVINYQLPMTMDSYIHRIGRTGRAGKTGMAYTFVG